LIYIYLTLALCKHPIRSTAFYRAEYCQIYDLSILDISVERLEFAKKMGADCTLLSTVSSPGSSMVETAASLADEVKRLLGSDGPTAVVECSGSELCLNLGVFVSIQYIWNTDAARTHKQLV
jgi:threonine dehydrogenase-like Zn-dependent dehydrogenase